MSVPHKLARHDLLGIVLGYATFAALWILVSDKLLEWLHFDAAHLALASTLKGWLFVAVTSMLLYGLLQRLAGGSDAPGPGPWRPGWALVLVGALVVALTGAGISHTVGQRRDVATARLQAIADLKAHQITDWLRERQGHAQFAQSSAYLAEQYGRWREAGDAAAGERLHRRLDQLRQFGGFAAVTLVDPRGQRLWGSAAAPEAPAEPLRAAMVEAGADRQVHRVGPYLDAAGRVQLDFVSPLTDAAGPPAFIVQHTDPAAPPFGALQAWPVPSATGECALLRREGDQVLILNALRHHKDSAGRLRVPLALGDMLSSQVLSGAAREGESVEGQDYRGVPVLGVVRAIPDTDWYLVAKLDRTEILADAFQDAIWIGLAGALALFMAGTAMATLRQRQQLAVARATQEAQAERLRALNLLAVVADNSEDAIFAKDLEGRYLLFNRAAARFVGRPVEEVLGRDDRALFPAEQAAMLMDVGRRVVAEKRTQVQEEVLDTAQGRRTFLATKGPLYDAAGSVAGIFGVSRDITERKQAEAALRQELEWKQRYLDTVQAIIVALDPQGRITMINRHGSALLGYTETELLGRNWFEACLPQPEGTREVLPGFQRIMAGDLAAVEHFESTVLCRDGRRRLVAWHNAYLRNADGTIGGALSSGSDITERKATEAELRRQAAELQARNAELERFNQAMVGRELDMVQFKREINALSRQLGRPAPFDMTALDDSTWPGGDAGP